MYQRRTFHDPEPPALLTVEQAGALCQIGRTRVYQLIAAGEWPSLKIGASTRVPRAALEAWIARRVQAERAIGT